MYVHANAFLAKGKKKKKGYQPSRFDLVSASSAHRANAANTHAPIMLNHALLPMPVDSSPSSLFIGLLLLLVPNEVPLDFDASPFFGLRHSPSIAEIFVDASIDCVWEPQLT
jgi:hypothetical protein